MKILHVVPEMNPTKGGVCQAVRTIIAGLIELEVYNEVACLDESNANFLANSSFVVHALGPPKGPWGYNSKLVPWLINHIPRFDAVVVHGLWLFYGYAVQRAFQHIAVKNKHSKLSLPKLFIMPHGMLDPYFQQAAGRRLKAVRNTIYWKLVEHKLFDKATAVLFTCEEESQLANKSFIPYRPQRTIVVGLGVEEPPAYKSAMQEALLDACPSLHKHPYILFLSRIHEKKGVELLLKAYAEINDAKQLVSSGIIKNTVNAIDELPKLLIAGPGLDTLYGKYIQKLVMNNSFLRKTVLFSGMLTGAAKWGAFYGCESFILASHQENFGIAVVEALACGKPVLISSQINIWREIIAAGGGLVAPDTLQGAQELLATWQSIGYLEKIQMQQRARATFELEFAVKPAAQRFLQAMQ